LLTIVPDSDSWSQLDSGLDYTSD